jgi:hypothetical protein
MRVTLPLLFPHARAAGYALKLHRSLVRDHPVIHPYGHAYMPVVTHVCLYSHMSTVAHAKSSAMIGAVRTHNLT